MQAQGKGHLVVDLGDDGPGLLYGLVRVVHRHAQGTVSVFVRRGHLDQGHVHRQHVRVPEEAGHLPEETGGEVPRPSKTASRVAPPTKEGVVAEGAGILRPAVLRLAHGHHVDDLHIFIGRRVLHQSVQQAGGLAAGVAHHTRSPERISPTASSGEAVWDA